MNDTKTSFRPLAIRYQVKDVDKAVEFYTTHLGFKLEQKTGPVGQVSNGWLLIWLSGPGASGSRQMPDGKTQSPGGWNRIALEAQDLPKLIEKMKSDGLHFRNEMESGPAGSQILLDDPDGNPIELFQPAQITKEEHK